MPIMNWDKSLELAVDEMNDQHKELLDLMNKIYDLNESGGDIRLIKSTVSQLERATVKHFREEEEYMASINYPEYEVHKGVHKNMLSRFAQYAEELEQKGKLEDGFIKFLKFWLQSHIKSIDMKYSHFSESVKKAA